MTDKIEKKFKSFIKYLFHVEEKSINKKEESYLHFCPCCNYPTLPERGSYHICVLCFWEDDGQDEPFCQEAWNGPNGEYSLSDGRNNFSEYLTYCSPKDKDLFEMNTDKNHLKIILIQKYEELKKEKNTNRINELKNEIEKIKDKFY